MGAKGIRPRKRRHPLPKVGYVQDDDTPPVMWPEKGSGFEPSAFSPAGSLQRGWRIVRTATQGRGRRQRLAAGAVLVGGVPVVAFLIDAVARLLRSK